MNNKAARNPVEFVRLGYHDMCTSFTVGFPSYDFDKLREAVLIAGNYNNFKPQEIVIALDKVMPLCYRILFGREGSPVLYFDLKGTFEEREKSKELVKEAFEEEKHDEYDDTNNLVRIWWD